MPFGSWRGVVGVIKPTLRPGSLEDFIRLLPEGIGVLPLFLDIREGTAEQFDQVLDSYEQPVKTLASAGVDLIHPEGAPPFMVKGFAGERAVVERWERAHSVPVVTAGMTQLEAMQAMGLRRVVGVTYFSGDINDTFARYFQDAGVEVVAMEGLEVAFGDVQWLSPRRVYAHAREAFLKHGGRAEVDGIYMLGSGWQVLDIVETLERDMGVPVVHPVTARVWAVQHRLHVRETRRGYGRLLAELPPPSRSGS